MDTTLLFCVLGLLVLSSVAARPADEWGDLPLQNPDLFEGDIILDEDLEDRNAMPFKSRLWTGGVVPYVLDPAVDYFKDTIEQVMRHIESQTCIRFVERSDQNDYIRVISGTGCYSKVGSVSGEQTLSLGRGCSRFPTIAHEITHALGFFHEHSRSDRNDYVEIHWDNIKPGYEDQFVRMKPYQNKIYNTFDYESIMLYGETVFSIDSDKKTMTAKTEDVTLKDVYDKSGLSESDFYRINQHYSCE